ncbi:uncharacterized protein [Argopecten irradians]|uniref:uncharacterized protein n=1 Tax=Argopecten irradians TaxID=31199 RepID=UPI0037121DAE
MEPNDEPPTYTELTNVNPITFTWHNGQMEESFSYTPSLDETVESLFTDTPQNPSREIPAYIEALKEAIDIPRDLLIDRIRELTHDSVPDLEQLRVKLYEIAKARDDFPVKEGYLRKRLATRKASAPPIYQKLAKDCFVLLRAVTGEYTEDIHEIIPKTKKVNEHTAKSQHTVDEGGVKTLRESIVTVNADLLDLKSQQATYVLQMENFRKEMEQMRDDKAKSKDKNKYYKDEIKSMRTQIDSLIAENEDIHRTLEKRANDNSSLKQSIATLSSEIQDLQQDNSKLRKQIGELKGLGIKLKSSMNDMNEKVTDCSIIARRFDDKQSNGTESIKNRLKHAMQTTKQCEDDIHTMGESINALQIAADNTQKQICDIKKQLKNKIPVHAKNQKCTADQDMYQVEVTNRFIPLQESPNAAISTPSCDALEQTYSPPKKQTTEPRTFENSQTQ